MIWSNKTDGLSVTSISTSKFGQVPISSLKLNASLYLYNMSITCYFSESIRQDLSKSTSLSNISLTDIFLLSLTVSKLFFV